VAKIRAISLAPHQLPRVNGDVAGCQVTEPFGGLFVSETGLAGVDTDRRYAGL